MVEVLVPDVVCKSICKKNVICAKFVANTIMCTSSDESDLDTDRISLEVVGENNNKH